MAISVLAVGTSPDSLEELPAPTSMTWGKSDVSSPDSGRTHDANATMHKNLVTSKRKLGLSWSGTDGRVASRVLRAFDHEYVYVRYRDALSDAYEVRCFYCGDMSASVRYVDVGGTTYSVLSFNIVER